MARDSRPPFRLSKARILEKRGTLQRTQARTLEYTLFAHFYFLAWIPQLRPTVGYGWLGPVLLLAFDLLFNDKQREPAHISEPPFQPPRSTLDVETR